MGSPSARIESCRLHAASLAVHGGLEPDPGTGAILPPIVQSTTFVQAGVGQDKGYTYSRSGNPTVTALERHLGSLYGAERAIAFGTGMAATTALCLSTLRSGDHVLVSDVVYGGTLRLLREVLAPFGIEYTAVDTSDLERVERALTGRTRLVIVETPANPTLKLTDLYAVHELVHAHGAVYAVDNTFLTAFQQDPFAFGADCVIDSTTKYVDGHNATVGGVLVTRDPALEARLRFTQNAVGNTQKPFDAWLTLQGAKTLPLRLRHQSQTALQVARHLEDHGDVRCVSYPGLASFPQFDLAQRQQRSPGALIAFELEGGIPACHAFLGNVRLIALAENLGSVQTLVTHPASMTHADVPVEARRAAGIGDGLIRLSVGLEDPRDLIADLERALCAGKVIA